MMAPAFLIYLAYLMSLASARSAVEDGASLAGQKFVITHAVFLLLAVILLYRSALRAWWLRRGMARVST